jgi:hypothetical protein
MPETLDQFEGCLNEMLRVPLVGAGSAADASTGIIAASAADTARLQVAIRSFMVSSLSCFQLMDYAGSLMHEPCQDTQFNEIKALEFLM